MAGAFLLGRELRRVYGVRGPGVIGSVIGGSDLNIVYTSRYFQPCADSFDERFEFVGPLTASRSEIQGFPWHQVRHPTIVYVSLGTLFNTDIGFYRKCFEAFAGEDCQVILSTGTGVNRESLGRVPPNFVVEMHVPQLEVLRRASAFVTHGGMNSVSESLCYGVPVVVVPQTGEQAIVGRRVEELGAGLYLATEQASPATLRESVQRLLAEEAFRRHAGAVRESLRDAGGAPRAAAAILRYTRTAQS
jgi:MGT family glycosyltransferase